MKQKVIARKYLPLHLPVFPTLTIWLFLDRVSHPSWVTGVVWTIWAILCLASVIHMLTATYVLPSEIKPND